MSCDNQELCDYLKQGHFKRFMKAWKAQFESYGYVAGTISISLDDENREDISGFIGKDFHRQKHAKISCSQVKKAILNSKYELADFNEVVLLYFDNQVISNKSVKIRKQEKCEHFLQQLILDFQYSKASHWLQTCIVQQESILIRMKQEILTHPNKFNQQMHYIMEAINQFPVWNQYVETFPIFATKITQDPHAFDSKKLSNLILFHSACFFTQTPYKNYSQLEKNLIFAQVGLVQEEINNYCMIARISALTKEGNRHPGWLGFYENYEMWNVNSHNLFHISKIDTNHLKHVFIIENPSVFHELCEFTRKEQLTQCGFICTNGILNMCAYQLLQLLENEHVNMHYCGDFDPEGLLIADRLTQQFKYLNLWCYEKATSFQIMHSKVIEQRRITMLQQLTHPQLIQIGKRIEEGFIGYQESLIEVYKEELLQLSHK